MDAAWICCVLLTALLYLFTVTVSGETICKEGYGYPFSCPDPAFPKCCRHYYTPACCEARAKKACMRSKHSKYDTSGDPNPGHAAVYCPRPGQSSHHTVCSYNNSKISCMSTYTLGAIIGGVFGGILLIGLVITGLCCYMVKSGRWVCVKIRPGKYQVMGKKRAERFRQQQLAMAAGHQIAPQPPPQGAPQPPPGYTSQAPYNPQPPPSYSSQPPAYSVQNPAFASHTQTEYWKPSDDPTK